MENERPHRITLANLADNEATPEKLHGDLTLCTLAMHAYTNSAGEIIGD